MSDEYIELGKLKGHMRKERAKKAISGAIGSLKSFGVGVASGYNKAKSAYASAKKTYKSTKRKAKKTWVYGFMKNASGADLLGGGSASKKKGKRKNQWGYRL